MKTLSIKVYRKAEGQHNIELPKTSEFLSNRNLIPRQGETITLVGDDHKVLGINTTAAENQQTVQNVLYNYLDADVAVFTRYQVF